jgi:hypothetical protein
MELRFDHDSWLDASRDSRIRDGGAHRLDWQALAIRLAAGHAFQRTLAEGDVDWRAPVGSFDPAAAQQLIDYASAAPTDWGFDSAPQFIPQDSGYHAVNPVVLGVRKSMSGKDTIVAGPFLPAIEGQV